MNFLNFLFLVLIVSVSVVFSEDEIIDDTEMPASNKLARGFGDDIKWITLEEALRRAGSENKPIFLLIHKSWCGACRNLKPLLSQSYKFKELSENFLMVNTLDDEEPEEKIYAPDGSYIPRLLFIDPLGAVKQEIYNENGNPKYKYYYSSAESVISSMSKAIELFKSSSSPNQFETPEEFEYLKHESQNVELDYDEFDNLEQDFFSDDLFDEYNHQEL